MDFFTEYEKHVKEREALGVPPLPLNEEQTKKVCELLRLESAHEREYLGLLSGRVPAMEPGGEGEAIIAARLDENQKIVKRLVNLLANRVNPGVDDAAKVKAEFLNEIINHGLEISGLDKIAAVNLLRPMLGGYSVIVLLESLKNADEVVAQTACNALKETIFVHDYFNDVAELAKSNKFALEVLRSWAEAEWFRARESLPRRIRAVIFKVAGETNTDDLSPASEAYTRSDIPLHANAMLVKRQPGSLEMIGELKKSELEVVYAGDVVGTGSSRKSGINSIQWHLGREIEGVPNKKTGGIVIGTAIAPIFFNTAEDSGALPIVADVSALETGDVVDIYPYAGEIFRVGRVNLSAEGKFDGVEIYGKNGDENLDANAEPSGKLVARFTLAPNTIFDEIRAGGRIPLIIGRSLCTKARATLNLGAEDIFAKPAQPQTDESEGYTLAQKIVGKACGVPGVRAG